MQNNSLLNIQFSNLELDLIAYAKENNVPIIKEDGLSFLELLIKLTKPKKILEVGTAIGFSAIRMHEASNGYITTIERNEKMYNEAISNIKKAGYEDYIRVIYKDALECYELLKDDEFDLIFIDAAKAQYSKFFDMFSKILSKNGIIVCDNMSFHGLVDVTEEEYNNMSRSVRGLVRKLNAFRDFLNENQEFDTKLYLIGDGMSVSIRKEK